MIIIFIRCSYQIAMHCANYASCPKSSVGRKHPLFSYDDNIDCFQRDKDRIIYSTAFHKLQHKTQIFLSCATEQYMSRLTHSLEVAQISRTIARELGVNEDLSEAISLAHDLGHPPFGHTGEFALQEVTKGLVPFDHNVQTIRILVQLEETYPNFKGLNLSWEVLEGLVKHHGLVVDPHILIKRYDSEYDFKLSLFPSIEAQISAVADDIAYSTHDIDDGVRSGIISLSRIEGNIEIMNRIFYDVRNDFSNITDALLLSESLRRLIAFCVKDVIDQAKNNIFTMGIDSVDSVRNANKMIVSLSERVSKICKDIRAFLTENLYNHYSVACARRKSGKILMDLFNVFFNEPLMLPMNWAEMFEKTNDIERSVVVCDYISGMTDKFAIKEHQRIFDAYGMFGISYCD